MKNVLTLGALLVMLAGCGGEALPTPSAQPVVTAVVARASLPAHLDLTGTLTADQTTIISAKIPGRIATLGAEVGTRVAPGTLLATLDRETESTALRAITRSLAEAEKNKHTLAALYDERIAAAETTRSTTERTSAERIAILRTELKAAQHDTGRGGDTTLTSASIALEQTIDTLDRILGVSPRYEALNDGFQNYLGALDTSTKTNAENALRTLITTHTTYRADYDAHILNRTPTVDERTTNTALAITALEAAKSALDKTYTLLIRSITGSDFSESALDGYKTAVTQAGGQIESLLLAAKTLRDSRTDTSQIAIIEQRIAAATSDAAAATEQITLQIATLKKEKTAKLSEAEAAITVLTGQAELSDLQLADTRITAPSGGVVTKKLAEVGQTVSPGTPIFEVVDDSQLKLTIGVPDSDAASLPVGREATITVDGVEGKTFTARITRVEPSADAASHKVTIELTLKNPGELRSGMFARATFALAGEDGVVVPTSAVINRYGAQFVFVAANGHAVRRDVVTGTHTDTVVVITSGLTAGETIIVRGNAYLRDGDAITTDTAAN